MNNLDRLACLLERGIDAYSRLLQIEREKEQAILANKAEGLLEALEREEPLVREANGLEVEILECRSAAAAEAGLPGGATLREIAARLGPGAARLEQLRTRLFGLAEEIRRVNLTNYLLLKQSIELLDELVAAVLGEAAPCSTYRNDGRVRREGLRETALSVKA